MLAVYAVLELTKSTRVKCKSLKVKARLITDGKANVQVGEGSMKENLQKLVTEVGKYGIELTVYDTRPLNVIDPAPSYISLLEETSGAHVFRI